VRYKLQKAVRMNGTVTKIQRVIITETIIIRAMTKLARYNYSKRAYITA